MANRLNVIYLPGRGADPTWEREVVAAIGPKHNLTIYDESKPLAPQFADVDAVVDLGGSWGTREMLDAAPKVQFWQIMGTGMEHFDFDYWSTRPVMISNCPGPMSAIPLAEHAILLMMLVRRNYPQQVVNVANGLMYQPMGFELAGQTLLCIGFGASARELSKRAKGFGMRVIATDIVEVDDSTREEWGADAVYPADRLDDLIPQADVVSLHLHVTPETRHTLDARRIALMKPTAIVVNVARGALVDEDAMIAAVREGRIAGAGTDVATQEPPSPGSPLLTTPGIVVTPHTAGVTDGTARRRAEGSAINIDRIAEGLEPLYRVDRLPKV
ncbi:MAG: NAD(P)-dependent oxidoreductase [Planctomycetaceae bacterium]